MKSKITGGPTSKVFETTVLNKHRVSYYQCDETGFIQTEKPFWLNEAYSSAITKLDLGLISRNIRLAEKTEKIIMDNFDSEKRFLDYAGGYGVFTRIMRDKGFDFYHTDPYCMNLFAEYFSIADAEKKTGFELTTCFEVAEHLLYPKEDFNEICKYSDSLFFTTELIPDMPINDVNDWWYFIPETGQHISLYTKKSLEHLSSVLGYYFHTDGQSLHLFTKKKLSNPFEIKRERFLIRKAKKFVAKEHDKKYPKKESLLQSDWERIKQKTNFNS